MLTFSAAQNNSVFSQNYLFQEESDSDEMSSNYGIEEFSNNIEIVIDQVDFLLNDPVKKVKINNHTATTKSVNSKKSAPLQRKPTPSFKKSSKSTKSALENLNKSNFAFKINQVTNFQDNLCIPQDILGKRRNPVFEDAECSVSTCLTDSIEKAKMHSDMEKFSVMSETTAEEENNDRNADGFIPIGPGSQAELPKLIVKTPGESCMRKSPKLKWNPETISTVALNDCFEKMYQIISQNISNHEKAVNLLVENDMNVDKLLSEMKKNKLVYRGMFSLNQRVRRNKTLFKESH